MIFSSIRKAVKGLSIQNKFILINVSVTMFALLFAVVMAVVGEYKSKRDFILEALQVQSEMVANNTAAALVFKDKNGAKQILQSFSVSLKVHSAVIYNENGEVFEEYFSPGPSIKGTGIDVSHAHDGRDGLQTHLHNKSTILNNEIHIIQKIIFEDKIIGSLYLQADISDLYDDIISYLIYTSSMALIGLAFASLILIKLSKSIIRPLLQLTHLMGSVIEKNDYSIRIENNSKDEIGVLSQGFNKMLSYIEANDSKLAHELSERYKAQEHLDKLAYYDITTELPNRHFFHKQLDHAVERSITTEQKMVLLFLDLDNFKNVNDTAGHETGDILLRQASARLSDVLRQNDYICRIGGDEFAIIIENVTDMGGISIVAKKCIESLSNPFDIDGKMFFIGVSIGISVCPIDTVTSNELLINADMAMYEAKIQGKNNYQYFNQEMNEVHSYRYQLENELRHAIDKNQLELYYQPQVLSETGTLVGYEALMRWKHPEKGLIPTGDYIPVAEETGLILPLGKWLIDTACEHARQLLDDGLKDVTIAINISGIQIREKDFINNITNALNFSGLDPDILEIELTESILMNDSELVIKKVHQLKKLGIHIAIDDFGTGFSSMNYLKSFPVTKLKIDKGFISGLPESSEDEAIVRAIIAMAHGLNINVIAEGVESLEQVQILKKYGCEMLQGYYHAKPIPFDELLQSRQTEYKVY